MKTFLSRLASAHAALCDIAGRLCSPLLLAIRLYWGWQFAQSGWGRLHNSARAIDFFSSLNIPFPTFNVYFVSGLEFVGGILLILGLFSRPIAFLLAGDMLVAYLTADRDALVSIFSNPGKFYGADPFTFLFASVLIFAFGPGKFSLDALIASRYKQYMHTNDAHTPHWGTDAVAG
jgi:putative oxidoreductase